MSMRKDTDPPSDDIASAAPTVSASAQDSPTQPSDRQISLELPEPPALEPSAMEPPMAVPQTGMGRCDEAGGAAALGEPSRRSELPKAVVAVMAAAESLKRSPGVEAAPPLAPEQIAAPPVSDVAQQSRSHRFALLAASVAFAGALGAMAGALSSSLMTRSAPSTQTPLAALDLTAVQDAIAGLRAELSSIKASVDSSSRNSSAQFSKFNERIDRLAQATAAQPKQAADVTQRAPAASDVTGSVRPQAVAVPPAAEPPRQPVVDGWVVRHVSRGVAVIQGRVGAIEVEAGDVVPGLGRIESIRRQDGRWVVLTSRGVIASASPR